MDPAIFLKFFGWPGENGEKQAETSGCWGNIDVRFRWAQPPRAQRKDLREFAMEIGNSAELVARLREGDSLAEEEMFRRYVQRLTRLVRSRMSSRLAQRLDADDVVQSVFASFMIDAREGDFVFERAGDLWRLLVTMALHKLGHQIDHHSADKCSMHREQAVGGDGSLSGLSGLALSREPSPDLAAAVSDLVEQVMKSLKNPKWRKILEMRLQGYSPVEIARAVGCSDRRVRQVLGDVKEELRQRGVTIPKA
jgi:RNA polymerase sigma factor (sigma-70 family)